MIRDAFLTSCRVMHELVGSNEVRERWHEPSVLSELTVGGLAGHIARAALRTEDFLNGGPPPDGRPMTAPRYYLLFEEGWRDPSSELNVGVRQRAYEEAAKGVDDLLWRIGESVARLHERIPNEPRDRLLGVFGRPMLLDDYLRTRIIELTVHLDDLATSVQRPTPEVPTEAMDEAISTLVGIALGRHGDLAVLRALAREERDEVQALRVL